MDNGNYKEALSVLIQLLEVNSEKEVQYRRKMAKAYEKLEQYEDAITQYQRLADMGNSSPEIAAEMSMIYGNYIALLVIKIERRDKILSDIEEVRELKEK
jgi:tetratricopeptide (TPR) repeat protein